MENQFNLTIKSDILERQADYLFEKAYERLGDAATEADVSALVAGGYRHIFRK